jgi:hypothetical protein
MTGLFAAMRRAGFDTGVSLAKLAKAMVEVLGQLPDEIPPSKEEVVRHLGLLGQMSKTRDINAAWNSAKRQATRDYPERFWLDGKLLSRTSPGQDGPTEKLSSAGQRKLRSLAAKEKLTPDELLNDMIAAWRKAKN